MPSANRPLRWTSAASPSPPYSPPERFASQDPPTVAKKTKLSERELGEMAYRRWYCREWDLVDPMEHPPPVRSDHAELRALQVPRGALVSALSPLEPGRVVYGTAPRKANMCADRYRPSPVPFTGRDDSRLRNESFSFEHARQLPVGGGGGDSYRPERSSGRGGGGGSGRGGSGRGGRGGARGRGGAGGGTWQPFAAHDRPLMSNTVAREPTPELMPGMSAGFFGAPRDGPDDRDPAGSDAGEAAMDTDDDDDDNDEPLPQQPATGAESVAAEPAAVSAADVVEGKEFIEGEKKRLDVISMIRSAKAASAKQPRDSVAANDDFISLTFDDEPDNSKEMGESSEDEGDRRGGKSRRLNDGSRGGGGRGAFSHRDHHYAQQEPDGKRDDEYEPRDFGPPGAGAAWRPMNEPPPGINAPGRSDGRRERPRQPSDDDGDRHGRNRARAPRPAAYGDKYDQSQHRDAPKPRKRKYAELTGKDGKGGIIDGNIRPEFAPKAGCDPFPWMAYGSDHSRTLEPIHWLHKELVDFAYFLQPRDYEHTVRRHLASRLRRMIVKLWPDTDVRVFGSFAAELYLPTSDIDFVVLSKDFVHGRPKYDNKKSLFVVANRLQEAGFCKGRPQVIHNAKVPIVKFVDQLTGLNVDISFENDSGLIANKTFNDWKEHYPAMPILVTVVKHFLAQRGLNEVYCGGMGSFAITCLVVSFLQMYPPAASGRLDPMCHLGLMLMEFLDLYGNRFDVDEVAIRVDRPGGGYFPKGDFPYPNGAAPNLNARNNRGPLFCIQDPNNAENDITRGSFLAGLIRQCFADAHAALKAQLADLHAAPFKDRRDRSILGAIVGGDYSAMAEQRKRMKQVFFSQGLGTQADIQEPVMYPRYHGGGVHNMPRPIPSHAATQPPLPPGPPPPPLSSPSPPPPPPPLPHTTQNANDLPPAPPPPPATQGTTRQRSASPPRKKSRAHQVATINLASDSSSTGRPSPSHTQNGKPAKPKKKQRNRRQNGGGGGRADGGNNATAKGNGNGNAGSSRSNGGNASNETTTTTTSSRQIGTESDPIALD